MNTITNNQLAAMKADMDAAAKSFFAYPSEDWQVAFQADWLQNQIGTPRAQSEDGLVWGAME